HAAALPVELVHDGLGTVTDGQDPVPGRKTGQNGVAEVGGGRIVGAVIDDEAVVTRAQFAINDLGKGSSLDVVVAGQRGAPAIQGAVGQDMGVVVECNGPPAGAQIDVGQPFQCLLPGLIGTELALALLFVIELQYRKNEGIVLDERLPGLTGGVGLFPQQGTPPCQAVVGQKLEDVVNGALFGRADRGRDIALRHHHDDAGAQDQQGHDKGED